MGVFCFGLSYHKQEPLPSVIAGPEQLQNPHFIASHADFPPPSR